MAISKIRFAKKFVFSIDLCMTSWELQDQVRHCQIVYGLSGISDHEPVETEFNIDLVPKPVKPKRNWKLVDEEKFVEVLETSLPKELNPARDCPHKDELDQQILAIVRALQAAIDATVPWIQITAHSRPGFNRECHCILGEAKRL